ncbi:MULTISPECIES: hypothetical protein [Duncaniella]|uniref:Uncharacterized protein n=1 Tax=Duncaniella dubosii TaxID=2518971 RepID=A0A4P7W2L1_9BACT|nr:MULTISPECIES: hypothetical protein [Duncaniella]MBJ2190591.1 hypothetical protein [Muribaculaceae bacterium]MCX4285324.1 hypothetical protein [Duncaniella dubosii]QCD42196.1 hypothetical protein E7747_07855 [Duncaniella dubosii]HBN63015.1 hypothetical protein [Porphyromonadaceae bacterium]
MSTKNRYEYLKIDFLEDVSPVEAQSTWRVTKARRESVTIFSSLLPDGSWVYGYAVNWANGRTSVQQPTAALGRFRSQRDAKLYAIGFMLLYLDYFIEDTRIDLRSGEASLLQAELF